MVKKKLPFGQEIRRIQSVNELTGEIVLIIFLIREYGERRLKVKEAHLNFWTRVSVESVSFRKNLEDKRQLSIGFPGADLETLEEAIEFMKIGSEPLVKELLERKEKLDRSVSELTYDYQNETRKAFSAATDVLLEMAEEIKNRLKPADEMEEAKNNFVCPV